MEAAPPAAPAIDEASPAAGEARCVSFDEISDRAPRQAQERRAVSAEVLQRMPPPAAVERAPIAPIAQAPPMASDASPRPPARRALRSDDATTRPFYGGGGRYCICAGAGRGEMVACDGGCSNWFHLDCLGLSALEVDAAEKWFCPLCAPREIRRLEGDLRAARASAEALSLQKETADAAMDAANAVARASLADIAAADDRTTRAEARCECLARERDELRRAAAPPATAAASLAALRQRLDQHAAASRRENDHLRERLARAERENASLSRRLGRKETAAKKGSGGPTRRPYTPVEDADLTRLVHELGEQSFETIAARLGTGRTVANLESRWKALKKKASPRPRAPPAEVSPEAPRAEARASAPPPALSLLSPPPPAPAPRATPSPPQPSAGLWGGKAIEMRRVGDAAWRRFSFQHDAAKAFGVKPCDVSELVRNLGKVPHLGVHPGVWSTPGVLRVYLRSAARAAQALRRRVVLACCAMLGQPWMFPDPGAAYGAAPRRVRGLSSRRAVRPTSKNRQCALRAPRGRVSAQLFGPRRVDAVRA
jgi:hypothetical protein